MVWMDATEDRFGLEFFFFVFSSSEDIDNDNDDDHRRDDDDQCAPGKHPLYLRNVEEAKGY